MRASKRYWLFFLPSLLGVSAFYVVPFLYSFYYAVIDNLGSKKFVGLQNFADTLANPLFRQSAGNTIFFVAVSVPLSMALALFLALCLQKLRRGRVLATLALLVPLVVPSGTIVYFWNVLFSANGLLQKTLVQMGLSPSRSVSKWLDDGRSDCGLFVEKCELQHCALLVRAELDPQNLLRADVSRGGRGMEAVR